MNEAICPRNKFVIGFQGAGADVWFRARGPHQEFAQTILATELPLNERIVTPPGEVSGSDVCRVTVRCMALLRWTEAGNWI